MANDVIISLVGLFATIIGAGSYFYKVKKHRTPDKPIFFVIMLIVGFISSVSSLTLTLQSFRFFSIMVILFATIPILMSIVFTVTFRGSKAPVGRLQVATGDTLLPFSAIKADGTYFSTSELKGLRVLLKFYRGSWCPYCSTELEMFDEMKPVFDDYNVKVIAISGDTPEATRAHQKRDNLSHLLLSDPELNIIKQYGVEHHKAFGGDATPAKKVLGLPFPTKMKYRSMAIPTSILVDEHGTIIWIDQSEDVRMRANEKLINRVLLSAFGH
ncbi:hypothetical protein C9J01_01840 [Photobacterium rosenbergii]|uniref:Thioredoxin domain-containing protein n=1 Tax=Photobacterium rosenbergii TaxID=294936 RepID=A0A2T3NK08_9GAMM|nr:redoxin domain-containing protein [Photobacterium rosenbergii]PSW15782.1 hypothetical protein C9J01_01840 [Photobacterium rosenbergii]